MSAQPQLRDQGFDLFPHLAIAGQHKLKRDAFSNKQMSCMDEEQLALLLAKAADTHQSRLVGDRGQGAPVKACIKPAVDDLDASSVLRARPTIKLACSVGADRDHKCRTSNFFTKCNGRGFVELFWTMDRKTERWAIQRMQQRCHFGRVGSEMRVHVFCGLAVQPA